MKLTQKAALPMLAMALAGLLSHSESAQACGCFAPPIPQPGEVDFAVNQQAEQIIFEVEDGYVTAHVLIKYAGDPTKFGWILPVPGVPELSLSYNEVFGLVDQQTAPRVYSTDSNRCPQQRYYCQYHPQPYCGGGFTGGTTGAGFPGSANAAGGASGAGPGVGQPPVVQVLSRQTIGAYETVVLAATPDAPDAASAVVEWLNTEGFITNETMAPYMAPYLADGMVFVAARLVPDAGVDEIRPLKLRYPGTQPMIPLRLTAVAAEPHLAVSAIIYADEPFQAVDMPAIELDTTQLSNDSANRGNYPMLLSKAVDDAGGAGFVVEYNGAPPRYQDPTGCCSQGNDWCFIGGDTQCQCPGTDFDAADCADQEDLVAAIESVSDLADRYSVVTRLTTRISPEEMTFDPYFEPRTAAGGTAYPNGALTIQGSRNTLTACETDIVDTELYDDIVAVQDCTSVYCDDGNCVNTSAGVGCACNPGSVARTFTDLDGQQSITCVPGEGTVDLAAGGIELPDVCGQQAVLTNGNCKPVGGFVTAECDDGYAAVPTGSKLPTCQPIIADSGSPGAQHMTKGIDDLDVCAPPPPTCGSDGWLTQADVAIPGVQCGPAPHPSWFVEPPAPTCGTAGSSSTSSGTNSSTTQPRPTPPTQDNLDTTQPRPYWEDSDDEGCNVGARNQSYTVLWTALFGLALGIWRRRR
jgi:hypothetical protein